MVTIKEPVDQQEKMNIQNSTAILEMRNITKRFPGVVANDSISFAVQRGEIHGLLGENGAGKTTLMKILFGLYSQDGGEIYIDGNRSNIDTPQEATDAGIAMVHQHFMLIPRLTVLENIILGARETPFSKESLLGKLSRKGPLRGFISSLTIDRESSREKIKQLCENYGIDVDLDKQVWELEVGEQQRVEILKALYRDAELLVLDEPTAVLSPKESDELFKTITELKEQGLAVILITHKLNEITSHTDRTTVLRDGNVIDTVETETVDEDDLAEMMVGREVLFDLDREEKTRGERVVSVTELYADDDRDLRAVNGVDLQVHRGEIVGIAGVSGNGQSELSECLAGVRDVTGGTIEINGVDITNEPSVSFIENGVSYIPSDRHKVGSSPDRSLIDNIILKNYRDFATRTSFDKAAARQYATELVEEYDVRAPSIDTPASKLSGGNLQKLICARELSRDPDLLIADQPTRGIDVGAIEYIRSVLLEQREKGTGILLISEDLDEVMQVSDRIVVMYDGEIVYRADSDTALREVIGQCIASGEPEAATDAQAEVVEVEQQ